MDHNTKAKDGDDDDDDDDDDLPIECLDLLMKQERVRIAAKEEDDRCEEKVQEVDAAIECNEKILTAIKERLKKYETLKSNVANLTEAIRELTKERDELRQTKQESSSTDRIQRLTDQLKEMKRKQRVNQKELRNAESCARRAKSLENLIVRLKTSKIQIQKRAKDRARQHRENMTSLGKQIRKLRSAHIKQQRKMSGLKHKHARTALKWRDVRRCTDVCSVNLSSQYFLRNPHEEHTIIQIQVQNEVFSCNEATTSCPLESSQTTGITRTTTTTSLCCFFGIRHIDIINNYDKCTRV